MKTTGRVLALLLVLATIGCDQVTKRVAAAHLAGREGRSFLGDTFRLVYAENSGGLLGIGNGLPEPVRVALFTVGAGLALMALAIGALRLGLRGWPLVGAILFVAGGASNLIDRAVRGSVVDFMNLGIGPVRTGIFNVADVALMAGLVLLMVRWGNRASDRPPEAGQL